MSPASGDLITELIQHDVSAHDRARFGLTGDISVCYITPRFDTSRHVIGLIFAGDDSRPRLVAKVPRQPFDNEGVQREADMLHALQAAAGTPVTGVPEIVGVFDRSGHSVLVESAIGSRPLDPDVVAEDLALAVRAGVSFVSALPVTAPAADNADWYERTVTAPLADLVRFAPMSGLMSSLVEHTHAMLAPLRDASLPAVFEHADLSYPNLFLNSDGALEVIDWERSTRCGVPAHDLVFLLQHLSESSRRAYRRPDQGTALDAAFLDPTAWAPDLIRRYLTDLDVSPDLTPYLVLTTWARSTATLVGRMLPADVAVGRPSADAEPAGSRIPDISAGVQRDRDFHLWKHVLQRYSAFGIR